jgi:hypothetical protein
MATGGTLSRSTVGLAGALVGLAALAMGPLSLIASTKPAWFFFGFEVVILAPATFAVLYALGRWTRYAAIGLTCIAGAIFMASSLAYLSLPAGKFGSAGGPVGEIGMKSWLAARLAAAAAVAVIALVVALQRDRDRWKRFLVGAALAAVALASVGGFYFMRGSPILAPRQGATDLIRLGALGIGACLLLAMVCAAAHLIIRAFEPRPEQAPGENADALA